MDLELKQQRNNFKKPQIIHNLNLKNIQVATF